MADRDYTQAGPRLGELFPDVVLRDQPEEASLQLVVKERPSVE